MPAKYHIIDRRHMALRTLGQSTLGTLMLPAYRVVFNLRRERYLARRAPIPGAPVVAVGGTQMGGSGKTPVTCALYNVAAATGKRGAIVLKLGKRPRRYLDELLFYVGRFAGGQVPKVEIGDGCVLVDAPGAVICAHTRKLDGARIMACREGVDFVIVDDAQQLFSLQPALAICLLHSRDINGRLFPQGMMREGYEAIARADLALALDGYSSERPPAPHSFFSVRPSGVFPLSKLLEAWIPGGAQCESYSSPGAGLVAFAGIGWPEGFEASLLDIGITPKAVVRFPNHQCYRVSDLRLLERARQSQDASAFITTEKDGCRLLPIIMRAMYGAGSELPLPEALLPPPAHFLPDLVVAAEQVWGNGYYTRADAGLPPEAIDRLLEAIS